MRPAGAATVPVSALRSTLDSDSRQVYWAVHPDGVVGRTLMQSAGSTTTIPLRLGGVVRFSARVRLLPHDWRDGVGTVRASIAVVEAQGIQRTLWSGVLPTGAAHGRPNGLSVTCELPASTSELRLAIDAGSSRGDPPVARAVWVEPVITDPGASGRAELAAAAAPRSDSSRPQANKPLISVLTPVHDPPLRMLEEAIASVRSQTFTNWELCLVDDGSTNPEIIAALRAPRRLRPPHPPHPPRPPPAASPTATNAALELATGEYIALLDHDDTLTPDALAARRRPASPPTRPRHDLQRRGHRHGRPADLGASQARLVAGHAAHERLHVPSRRLPARRSCRRSAASAPSSTARRTST